MKRLLISSLLLLTVVSVSAQEQDSAYLQCLPTELQGDNQAKLLPSVEVVAFIDTTSSYRICGSYCYKIHKHTTKSSPFSSVTRDNSPGVLKLYPNPSPRGAMVYMILQERGQLTVYDLSGKVMMVQPGNPGMNRVMIPISYSTGTYLLRQGNRTTKLVIQ